MDIDAKITVAIYGLPKKLTGQKIKIWLERLMPASLWKLQLIPLEEWNTARVLCVNMDVCGRILGAEYPEKFRTVNFKVQMLPPIKRRVVLKANQPSLLDLNFDCLCHLLQYFEPKEQIRLAKVCNSLYNVIACIWKQKYRDFYYGLQYFERVLLLDAMEVHDFCAIAGQYVENLIFNSNFDYHLMKKHTKDCDKNIMKACRLFANIHLCRNLSYFGQLQSFVVQGPFLADFTVAQLARYCKRLHIFDVHDAPRNFTGKYVRRLALLEELSIRDCDNFERRHLLRVCRTAPLQSLNIVKCQNLGNVHFLKQLSANLENLLELKLSALLNEDLLECILQLKSLKKLRFYWINSADRFEEMLFSQLLRYKRTSLVGLKFRTQRLKLKFGTHNSRNAMAEAAEREKAAIEGCLWHWCEEFGEFIVILEQFSNLQEIVFNYCRFFDKKQLLQIPEICRNMKNLKLVGCRSADDGELMRDWAHRQSTSGIISKNCNLIIEGLIPVIILENMRERGRQIAQRLPGTCLTVIRSIECQFQ